MRTPVLDGQDTCEEIWKFGQTVKNDYVATVAAYCRNPLYNDLRTSLYAYQFGQFISVGIRDICGPDDDRELPFGPDGNWRGFWRDIRSCFPPKASVQEDDTGGASKNDMYEALGCGPVQHTASEPCVQALEAQTYCDTTCKKIVSTVLPTCVKVCKTY